METSFSKGLGNKGFVRKRSNGSKWLRMKLLKQVSDYLDFEGKVRDQPL